MHYILQCGSANSETLGLVEHSAHRDSAKCRSNKTEIRFAAGERVPETVNAFPLPPLPSPCLASSLLHLQERYYYRMTDWVGEGQRVAPPRWGSGELYTGIQHCLEELGVPAS